MVSGLTWDDAMPRLYSGMEEREKFAREIILPRLYDIEDKIKEKRRNLKKEYFNKLLDEEDGFILVECMAHLRKKIVPEKDKKVLRMILDEWADQTADSYDTFCSFLETHPKTKPIHICNALILRARRLRGRAGGNPKNAKTARKLVEEAGEIWTRHYGKEMEELDGINNFCLVPNRLYENVIKTQGIFCDARFSNMNKVWTSANEMIDGISKVEETEWGGHKSNLILKWWMHQVKLRASTVCMDPKKWMEAKVGMEEIEKDLEGSTHSDFNDINTYFNDIKGGNREKLITNPDKKTPINDLIKMRVLLACWSEFRKEEERVKKFRRRGGSYRSGDGELINVQNNFTNSLKEFNLYLMMGVRDGFVSHAYARDENQSKKRTRKILGEISEGRRSVTQSDTNHSCFQLEVLHRLLIYRLWWESVEKPFDLFSNAKEELADIILSLKIPKKILEDIKYDLEKIHINQKPGARWRKEIDESIKVFSDGGENLAGKLKTRIEEFDQNFRTMQWPPEQADIMGLPYNEEEISPYDVMDPTMRHVGVNAEGPSPEQRLGSQ